jgi:tetratricopeptide (TPR) repeat protein
VSRNLTHLLCIAGLIGFTSACSTGSSPRYETGSNSFDAPAPNQAVAEADRLIQNGDSAIAVGRLQEIIARYPGTAEAAEAQYLLGVAYENIGGLRDAITAYDDYIALAPDGEWADESRIAGDRLRHQYTSSFPAPEALDREIDAARAALQAQPDSAEAKLRLADTLWRRGVYDEAGALYLDLAKRDPNFAASDHFRTRVERRTDGSHTILTPTEISRRAAEKNPIVVTNLNSFSAVRDSFTQIPLFFVVTGQAVNRAESVIYGVNVTVTTFGFGSTIYDTQTTTFGDMAPGETRAFSMRFSNFRELNSIDRYEYAVSFRR